MIYPIKLPEIDKIDKKKLQQWYKDNYYFDYYKFIHYFGLDNQKKYPFLVTFIDKPRQIGGTYSIFSRFFYESPAFEQTRHLYEKDFKNKIFVYISSEQQDVEEFKILCQSYGYVVTGKKAKYVYWVPEIRRIDQNGKEYFEKGERVLKAIAFSVHENTGQGLSFKNLNIDLVLWDEYLKRKVTRARIKNYVFIVGTLISNATNYGNQLKVAFIGNKDQPSGDVITQMHFYFFEKSPYTQVDYYKNEDGYWFHFEISREDFGHVSRKSYLSITPPGYEAFIKGDFITPPDRYMVPLRIDLVQGNRFVVVKIFVFYNYTSVTTSSCYDYIYKIHYYNNNDGSENYIYDFGQPYWNLTDEQLKEDYSQYYYGGLDLDKDLIFTSSESSFGEELSFNPGLSRAAAEKVYDELKEGRAYFTSNEVRKKIQEFVLEFSYTTTAENRF